MNTEISKNFIIILGKYLAFTILIVGSVYILAPYLLDRAIKEGETTSAGINVDSNGYGISETIRAVKSELYKAQIEMIENKEEALFQAKSFDLELNFIVRSTRGATIESGAPKFLVISDTSQYSAERVQRIKLHFVVLPDKTVTGTIEEVTGHIKSNEIEDLSPEVPSNKVEK